MTTEKTRFEGLLRSTGREGVENVLAWLEKEGFYESPASTKFHESFTGGLLIHSLKVCEIAKKLKTDILEQIPDDSVILCSLLHDVCKIGLYHKKADGTFYRARRTLGKGHGTLSVCRLEEQGLLLLEEEKRAIRWHMGAYTQDYGKDEWPSDVHEVMKNPLARIIHKADCLSIK